METAGVTPAGAVTAPDLAEVTRAEGPFATVYLTTEQDVDNASQRSEQRWKTLRGELAEAGAQEAALAAVDPLVPDAHVHGSCLAAIANAQGLLHVEHGPGAPPGDMGRWDVLPWVVPLLEWRQASLPHVLVLADRQGADLVGVRYEGRDLRREAGGKDFPLRKTGEGGWSQRRYEERAENIWQENAEDVAKELTGLVQRIQARLVVVAGDVRAVQLLQRALPGDVAEMLEVVGGGRSSDGSRDAVSEDVQRLLARLVERDTEALLEKLHEELGQGDRAVEGAGPAIEALSKAQVDVLLIRDDPDDDRRAWFGPDPSQLAETAEQLRQIGVEAPVQGRRIDVLVRAALGIGAGIRVTSADRAPRDGVAAILRWAEGG